MHPRLTRLFNRLEALSARERLLAIVGTPLLLTLVCEGVIFAPARSLASEAVKQADRQAVELKAIQATLATLPADKPLPAPDQLRRQRDELRAQVDAARQAMAAAQGDSQWGQVLRRTLTGTTGLALAQLRTQPPELMFSPASLQDDSTTSARKGTPAASAPATAKQAPRRATATSPGPSREAMASLGLDTVYRHRAEITITGDMPQVIGYLQSLQTMPTDVRWDRVQITATAYPQASAQMRLYTLSRRAETPFN